MSQNHVLLLDTVSEICKLKTRGKVLQDEAGRVHIFDCFHWTEECAHMLQFILPNAIVSVESCISSLSGFVLLVQHPPKSQALRQRILWAVCLTLLTYACLYFLYHSNDAKTCFLSFMQNFN